MNMEMEKTAAPSATKIRSIILCGLFAALTVVGSYLRIPLPVIPFTLQYFFVAFSGFLLGARRGAASQLIFAVAGLAGLPVFTKGGGLWYIFEPSFGYIIGFVLAAWFIGKCMERLGSYTIRNCLIASVLGMLLDYACGVLYMYLILNFYLGKATPILSVIFTGAVVFAPKDLALCIVTALCCNRLVPLLKKTGLC
ncbi:MAG: biotin transporter BioY [Provencibacterium sp.]|nr:biotin transporter BioY [Provencibacterium sp.]